ncbi:MAG: anhydro-N-acetylmuramic acid kinase, partial [bacterium]
RNPALVRALRAALAPRRLRPVAALGLPGDALEAVCFALLGWARLRGRPNVLPAVTGARRAACAGVLVPAS